MSFYPAISTLQPSESADTGSLCDVRSRLRPTRKHPSNTMQSIKLECQQMTATPSHQIKVCLAITYKAPFYATTPLWPFQVTIDTVEQVQCQCETATRDRKDMADYAKQHRYLRTLHVDSCSNPLSTTCSLRGWVGRTQLSVFCEYWNSMQQMHNFLAEVGLFCCPPSLLINPCSI